MTNLITSLYARMRDETGQALAEYGLILALIAVVCIVALGILGLAVAGQLDEISDAMPITVLP